MSRACSRARLHPARTRRDRHPRRPPRKPCPARPSSSPEAVSRASSSPRRSPIGAIRSPWCTPPRTCSSEWDDQPRLVARAEAELARLGVTVLADRRRGGGHADHRPRSRTAACWRARTVVATTGQRPVRIPGLDRWRDDRGRLRTHRTLAVTAGVWAAGDAARVGHPVTRAAGAGQRALGHQGRRSHRARRSRASCAGGERPVRIPRTRPRRLVRLRQGDRRAVRHPVHRRAPRGCCGSCSSCASCPRGAARPESCRMSRVRARRRAPSVQAPSPGALRGADARSRRDGVSGLTPSGGTTRTSRPRRRRSR